MYFRFLILLYGLGLAEAKPVGEIQTEANEGHDWDIIDINTDVGLDLLEGDIKMDETVDRNTIIGEKYRWPTSVPYYLENSLGPEAKAVILSIFEQFRLKSCIDFKPWKGEENYISVFKGDGCWSYVGNRHVGKQNLSIGIHCDTVGIVEHEFLHALGFWHEQSRDDRDDYINIKWNQIKPGQEYNFEKHNDTVSSALGVPYDYGSVMHYGKTAFSIDSEPTIVTKIPHFMNVIGQRKGFSSSDLIKLNRLYNCTRSSTFVDSCDFEEDNICGMIQIPGKGKWEQQSCMRGGPQTDFTNMGQCKGKGYFMHFNTCGAELGSRAVLDSRWLYPKPGPQCLQFFLYNTGADDDVLNIWVREYDHVNSSGKAKFFKSISGGEKGSWNLHAVNLNMTKKSRVVFDGVRGKSPSKGGFSLDDINLSSTKCPQHVWQIHNMKSRIVTTPAGQDIYSPRFLSPAGYSFQISLYLNGTSDYPGNLAVYFHLTSGPNDEKLKWPCPWYMATMTLMDQQSDIRQQTNHYRMIITDPARKDGANFYWDNPRKVGVKVTESDGSFYYRGPGLGYVRFFSHSELRSRKFIKGDDGVFLLSLEDISHLLEAQPLPHSAVRDDASLLKTEDQGNFRRTKKRGKEEAHDVLFIKHMPGFVEEYPEKEPLLSNP